MESQKSPRWILYILMLTAFFIVMIVMDQVFGIHYTPNEPIQRKKAQPTENSTSGGHSASAILPDEDVELLPDTAATAQTDVELQNIEDPVGYFEALKKKYLTELKASPIILPERIS